MATEWIEHLADDIKQKNHEAAEQFGRAQHQAGIITERGRPFFADMVRSLQDNVSALRAQLQGDPASAEMAIQTIGAAEAKLTRSRFPWFDAHLVYRDPTITLDYAKDRGTAGDVADRKSLIYEFHVAADDTLSVRDAFGDQPAEYVTPADLARSITELLFAA